MRPFTSVAGCRVWRLCLPLLLACALSACVAKQPQNKQPEPVQPPQESQAPEPASQDEGVSAFLAGQYRKAAGHFATLAESGNPQARCKALYGLACCKLMLASNAEEHKKALQALEAWEKVSEFCEEDPRLLAKVARHFKPPYLLREAAKEQPKSAKNSEPDCTKKLAEKEKEVKHLQKQLNALEAIHREIQEKKRGMSSP